MTISINLKTVFQILYVSFIMILFEACYSNRIYFDINKQSIVSCSPNRIRQLYISNDSSSETYFIVWEKASSSAPKTIDLKNIQEGYIIYKGWDRKQIALTEFKLSGLAVYTISRMQGDAGSYTINVSTDKKGDIVKSSRTSCDVDSDVSK